MFSSQNAYENDSCPVHDELLGELYRADQNGLAQLVESVAPDVRAMLALFCYRKAHLRRIGLAIAATCDLPSLVQKWGTVLGHAIFNQSRDRTPDSEPPRGGHRPKVTLARSAGGAWPSPVDIDEPS